MPISCWGDVCDLEGVCVTSRTQHAYSIGYYKSWVVSVTSLNHSDPL